ncbi:penicillin-binding transpeptidase domain-containing protein [Cellulomonas shaoxiangyii]|uniref:Beta-lactamase n=1 Tax=Cellulomonas shaoxiangyii TaxID=2566013 RepID=A0A4P7SL50_9CELL|nr:penicillin-binding transpeptidase domain-containing protein [Cellulomonas shaoxiangyii]QCB94942.1 penicillin-binding protein [Cellulomonas shaoxiangyii]TGY84450.1 penicillin-binding protein [Cellulomonas shaoxiangyii]
MATTRTARSHLRRTAWAAACAALLTSGVAACTPDRPEPRPAAEALAAALASGDFADVPLDAGAPAPAELATRRAAVVAGLGETATATVEVGDITTADDDETATAALDVTWDVPWTDTDWTWTADARLARDDEDAWTVAWSPGLLAPGLTDTEVLRAERTAAPRGDVLGAGDAVIVTPRDVERFGIDKTRVPPDQQDAAARALAAALGTDADAYAQRVAGAGEKAFVEAITLRVEDASVDKMALRALPGVVAVPDRVPLAPTRTFARPVLGAVGPATAEVVEASEGAVAAGDLAGLSGLQRQYDERLRGTPGVTVSAVPAEGVDSSTVRLLFRTEPVAGEPLRTTIDPALQEHAEGILAGVAPASAIVAVRPSTGDVVVAASGAGGEGMSTATLGQYAPGSTFKVVSALAYLRGGLTPASAVTCPPTISVDGRTFGNFPGYPAAALGDVPFRTAFAHSCNTAFIGSRDLADSGALADAARSLGLDPAAELGFPAFLGAVPDESSGTGHAASVIGQGQVLASPLGMATVAASVAAGAVVVPRLVVDPEPGGDPAAEPSPDTAGSTADAAADTAATVQPAAAAGPATPLTGDEAAALQDLMRAVVTEGGATLLADLPGEPVLAKTGTAQFGDDADLRNHAWMIAVQGDLAVAVFVGEGDYGSTTAGPLLRSFLAG